MSPLFIKELLIRDDLRPCLIVCPDNLVEHWQDQLYQRFQLPFDILILTNDKLEAARTGNWFAENSLEIARLDKLSRHEDVQARRTMSKYQPRRKRKKITLPSGVSLPRQEKPGAVATALNFRVPEASHREFKLRCPARDDYGGSVPGVVSPNEEEASEMIPRAFRLPVSSLHVHGDRPRHGTVPKSSSSMPPPACKVYTPQALAEAMVTRSPRYR
jgi:hypothetical protein